MLTISDRTVEPLILLPGNCTLKKRKYYSGVNMESNTTEPFTSFNIRPGSVNRWIKNLPLGSTGETSKQLYWALKIVNEQNNSIVQHLGFLDQIAPTFTLLYSRLTQYLIDISLPLNTKNRNAINATNALLSELIKGYQLLIKKLQHKKPFGWKKSFALALHRNFIYHSQKICTNRQTYQPYSKDHWREIYWCYQQAENFNLLNKTFYHFDNHHLKTSIDYEFKKLILLSLLSSNDLGLQNMQRINALMPLWIKNVEITHEKSTDKISFFALNLLHDVPPYLVGTKPILNEEENEVRYVSTHNLYILLSDYLKKLKDYNLIKIANYNLSKLVINTLLIHWTRNHLRTENRKKSTGFIDIATGITAIHNILNQQTQTAYNEVSTTLTNNTEAHESSLTLKPINLSLQTETLGLGHFLGDTEQEEDIWEKVYNNGIDINSESNWADNGSNKLFNISKSIIIDYCKNGYRLSVNVQQVESLKINELVAIREHTSAPWALAQIKWLHYSERGDVQFGIRIITQHVLPINVKYYSNQTLSKSLPCLIGLNTKKLMLFVPSLPTILNGKTIQLNYRNQYSKIQLKNKLLTTSAFDLYEIHKDQTQSQAHNNTNELNSKIDKAENIWKAF